MKWLLLAVLICFLRLPSLVNSFMVIDEAEYAIAAMKILGGGLPYRDFLIYHPPLIFYFYALAFTLFRTHQLWSVHLLMLGVVFGTGLFLYKAGQSLRDERTGSIAALLYAVISTCYLPKEMLAANCEILAMLPTAIAAWLFLKGEKGNVGSFWGAGLSAGLAFLTKYPCGIVLAPMLFSLLFLKRDLKNSLRVSLGFLLPVALFLLLLYSAGIWREAEEAALYILRYARGPETATPLYVLLKVLLWTTIFSLFAPIAWFPAFYEAVSGRKNQIFLLLWFLFSFGAIAVGGRVFPHYFFIVLPSVSLLASLCLSRTRKKGLVIFGGVLTSVAAMGFFFYGIYLSQKPVNFYNKWDDLSALLKAQSRPGETLFVWGNAPSIYLTSELQTATRFTTADYLTGRTTGTHGMIYDPKDPQRPSLIQRLVADFKKEAPRLSLDTSSNIFPKAWAYLEEDFSKNLPTYIVDTSPTNYRQYGRYPIAKYPFLKETLANDYLPLAEVNGAVIYKRKL